MEALQHGMRDGQHVLIHTPVQQQEHLLLVVEHAQQDMAARVVTPVDVHVPQIH